MKYIVKKHEVGLLYKNGEFVKAIPAGKYSYSNYLKYKVILCDMRESLSAKGIDLKLVGHDELLKNLLDIIHVKDNEIALHYVDQNFLQILPRITSYNVCYTKLLRYQSVAVRMIHLHRRHRVLNALRTPLFIRPIPQHILLDHRFLINFEIRAALISARCQAFRSVR